MMKPTVPYTIQVNGTLLNLEQPQVMGILNVTPDSFYAESRKQTETDIVERTRQMLDEGAGIIDVGAYSSRPGADVVTPQEEMTRLSSALKLIRAEHPNAILSIDTFRADVAKMCVEEYGANIINDISGGQLDPQMLPTAAQLNVPYILMHMKGDPQTMQQQTEYTHFVQEVFTYFAQKIQQLRDLGAKDIILDPGFGFSKTLEQNYELYSHIADFSVFELPVLVGISRKSMIYKLLDGTPQTALNGTTALHMMALAQGANILRVHDVKEAVETVRIYQKLLQPYQ